ncbi:hypothetical protein [Schumannella sp. 10F1B-5-1]|uniref:hypothetical protein n=1 Tax=Schumannella sp. 10F1B-5-1 TaxID=2590780 RepID=UPI0011303D99|nr:hypothetical protein [Schumannella sp. 10F1B-5-1]TPW72895.1 hypothetical protein FJ658_06450 [Schumannella sp. 10F1B-5-1]
MNDHILPVNYASDGEDEDEQTPEEARLDWQIELLQRSMPIVRRGLQTLPTLDDLELAESLIDFCEASGIGFPYIPEASAPELIEMGDNSWGSVHRPYVPGDMYLFRPMLNEIARGDWAPRLRFGHAGHGVNSSAYSYQLVTDGFAMQFQVGGGGALTSREDTAASWNELTTRVRSLHEYVIETGYRCGQDGILVVAVSEMRRTFICDLVTWDDLTSEAPRPSQSDPDQLGYDGGFSAQGRKLRAFGDAEAVFAEARRRLDIWTSPAQRRQEAL